MKRMKLYVILTVVLVTAGNGFSQDLSLPDDFPRFTIDVNNDPDPGYLFMFARPQQPNKYPGYLMILDNYGTPVYYRYLPYQSGDFKIQRNGLISFLRKDDNHNQIYLMDSTFQVVDSVWMENYQLDSHDFIAMANGHFLLFGLDNRTIDMSTVVEGGQQNATVQGCVIQEQDENKQVVFEWNSFDHYQITDTYRDLTKSNIPYVHPNAIEVDTDGNIILSSREMNEMTKIDRQTGDIIWRLGGKNNQFHFADSSQMFSFPHNIRRLANGHLTMFDNGKERDPQYSRAIEYSMDEEAKTIEETWEYDAGKEVYSPSGGSVQRLPSGNTLTCYGGQVSDPSLIEVKQDGTETFRLHFNDPGIRAGSASKFPWKTSLFSVNTDTVDFGQWDGYTEALYLLKVKNNSDREVVLTGYHLRTNAFYPANNTFPLTLAPQEEKMLKVYYYPYSIQSAEVHDVLTINSDITSDTLVQRIAVQVHLTGTKIYSSRKDDWADGVKIYPNPAQDHITIHLPHKIRGSVYIYAADGSLVIRKMFDDATQTIDLEDMAKGIYMIRISDEIGHRYLVKTLVKI